MQSASFVVRACCNAPSGLEKRVKGPEAHLSCGNPSPRSCAPFGDQEAESMAGPQAGTCEECPLFADEPFVVLDIVCVGEEGVKGEKRDGVEVGVPGDGPVQGGTRNFGRPDRNSNPAERSVEDQPRRDGTLTLVPGQRAFTRRMTSKGSRDTTSDNRTDHLGMLRQSPGIIQRTPNKVFSHTQIQSCITVNAFEDGECTSPSDLPRLTFPTHLAQASH